MAVATQFQPAIIRRPVSDHFDGDTIFQSRMAPRPKAFPIVLKWKFRRGTQAKWPSRGQSPFAPARPEPVSKATPVAQLPMVGHATMLDPDGGA